MDISVYAWETTHDQASKTMTHVFANTVICIVSWENLTLTIEYQNKVIDVFPYDEQSYTVDDHTSVLVKIALIAQAKYLFGKYTRKRKLKKIRHELLGM